MRLHRAFLALAALVSLAACEKNAVQDITGPVPAARIKFFNFGVNAPGVQFYAGDTKLTAASIATCSTAKNPPVTATDSMCVTTGTESTTGITYGGVSSSAWYIGVDPGQYTFDARLMTPAADKGKTVASVPQAIADGKAYSYYVSGFYNTTTKTADAFIVEDEMPAVIDWSAAYVRLVNAIGNSQPMTLSAKNVATGATVTIGGATAYKSASAFVKLAPGAYDLTITYSGDATPKITRTNVGFEAGHRYSITARGDMTVTSTTATNRPFLDNTEHR